MRLFFILVLVLLVSPTLGSAQPDTTDTEFRIQDFIPDRFEDFEWNVDVDAGLRTSSHSRDVDIFSVPGPRERSEERGRDNYNWSFRNSLGYRYRTIQGFFNIRPGTRLRLGRAEQTESSESLGSALSNRRSTSSTNELDFQQDIQLDGGIYLLSDLHFRGQVYSRFQYSDRTSNVGDASESRTSAPLAPFTNAFLSADTSNVKTRNIGRSLRLNSELGLSWGRVYEGDFATTAAFIVEELLSKGLIESAPSRSQMLRLSELVYQRRLKHSVDARLNRIEIVDQITSFLEDEGILRIQTKGTESLIQDVWNFFESDSRRFGWTVDGGIKHLHQSADNSTSHEQRSKRIRITSYDTSATFDTTFSSESRVRSNHSEDGDSSWFAFLSFGYFHPVSYRWQVNGSVRWDERVFRDDRNLMSEERPELTTPKERKIDGGIALEYRHDARNRVTLAGKLRYAELVSRAFSMVTDSNFQFAGWEGIDNKTTYYTLIPSVSWEYRISPPTTIVVRANYQYDHRGRKTFVSQNNTSDSNFSLSFGLFHWIY